MHIQKTINNSITRKSIKNTSRHLFSKTRIIELWEKNSLDQYNSFSVCSTDETETIHLAEQMALELSRRHLRKVLLVDLSGNLNASMEHIDILCAPENPELKDIFLHHMLGITKEISEEKTSYCGYIISSTNTILTPENVSLLKTSTCRIALISLKKTKSSELERMKKMFDSRGLTGFVSI